MESCLKLLLEHTPTPLPAKARYPFLLDEPPLGFGGNVGELSLDTEREECENLDEAKKKVLEEIERLRNKLIDAEKELNGASPYFMSEPRTTLSLMS